MISLLTEILSSRGVCVVTAADDADTLVVREALKLASSKPVNFYAEDTDVLCMLIYHISKVPYDITFITKSGSYSMKAIYGSLPEGEGKVLLLAHAFSGCDTTSSICGFGKVRIMKKLASKNAPLSLLDTLLNTGSSRNDVADAGIQIFQYIYGQPSTNLHQIYYDMYNKSMAKRKLLPQKLPPTESAATHHTLQAFMQCRDWVLLQSQSLDPSEYRWSRSSGTFEPIDFFGDILNFTICNCSTTKRVVIAMTYELQQ